MYTFVYYLGILHSTFFTCEGISHLPCFVVQEAVSRIFTAGQWKKVLPLHENTILIVCKDKLNRIRHLL